MLGTVLIVVLVLLVLGAIPTWPYSRGWGYFPSGLLGIVLLVHPAVGVVALSWWLGAYALLFGIMLLSLAFRIRYHPI